jgi:alginate O-acetyltransferase complex protein AlgI
LRLLRHRHNCVLSSALAPALADAAGRELLLLHVIRAAYILILVVTIALDYYMGLRIAASTGRRRLIYLWVSIVSTCLVLFVFKYYNFFVAASTGAGRLLGMRSTLPLSSLILPIGLSFHTVQSLSYVVEVYRARQRPERHFGIYSLYVMFYPQLVAGPIERPQNLLHQFYEEHAFRIENVASGLSMMALGYFQKMVMPIVLRNMSTRLTATGKRSPG